MLEHSQALRSEQACVVHEGPPAHAYFKTLNQFLEKQYNTHKRIIVSHLLAREQNYVQYTPLKVRLFSMYSTYTHIFLHNHTWFREYQRCECIHVTKNKVFSKILLHLLPYFPFQQSSINWRTHTASQRGGEWMGVDKNYSRRR
jgi:hypothetical protein